MRPKVKISDVVRESGVSRATVDRVLNNRSGVKEATRQQVVSALETLGYAPDALSALKTQKPHDIRVFLLNGTNPFFAEIREGFQKAMASAEGLGLRMSSVDFDPYRPETLEQALEEPASMSAAIVAVGAQTERTVTAIDRLLTRGIPVVTVISDIASTGRHVHVGQDNFAAGRTAARLMAGMTPAGARTVALLIGHSEFKHLLQRRAGFRETLSQLRPDLTLVETRPYGGSDGDSNLVVEDAFAQNPDLAGLYLAGGGQPHLIDSLARRRSADTVVIGHELNPVSRAALMSGTIQALICHDMEQVARQAFDAAIQHMKVARLNASGFRRPPCGISVYFPENLPIA